VKKHATTLFLLLAAVVLGVWLWIDKDKVSEGERKRRETNVFVAWRKEDLSRVEIVQKEETIILERDAKAESSWRMWSPREERADQAAVEHLVTAMEFANIVRKPSEGTELGLDPEHARATGSVTMGGLILRFTLGAPSPRPEGSSYFRLEDEAPIVISKELTDTLLKSSDAYRDRTVVPYLSLDLASMSVKHADGGFALERLDERSFKVGDLGVLASRDGLESVWSALAEMRAESFPKEADVDRLTQNPQLTLLMKPKDGRADAVLVAGDACPGHPDDVVILRKEPTRIAACAPKGAIASLKVTPASLVDHRPFSFHVDEIEELQIGGITRTPIDIDIARKGMGFHERTTQDRDLRPEEADAANELISRLEKTHATSVTRGDGAPFDPIAAVTIHVGSRDEKIEVAKPNADGMVPVRRLRDDARLLVSRIDGRRMVPRESSLAPRALLGESRRVTRVLIHCGVEQELVDEGTGLKLVKPAGYETDASVLSLVEALTRGRVDEWISDTSEESFGLSGDACRVVLSFADGNAPAVVRFGADEPAIGGVYGKVEGSDRVFLVGRSVRDLAKKIYVSRAALASAVPGLYADDVLRLGPPDVGRVELELGTGAKRVRCGAVTKVNDAETRPCAIPDVKAVFLVSTSKLASVVAPDGGTR